MRLMTRSELRTLIRVAFTVLKPAPKRVMGLTDEAARDAVAEDLVQRIMGEPRSETVILQPDLTGGAYSRVGEWDVHEPHPCPDLLKR